MGDRFERIREIPLPSGAEVEVQEGDYIFPGSVVARVNQLEEVAALDCAVALNVDVQSVPRLVKRGVGEDVAGGDVLAELQRLFPFGAKVVRAPFDGVIDTVSAISGQVILKRVSGRVELRGSFCGTVQSVSRRVVKVLERGVRFHLPIYLGGSFGGRVWLEGDETGNRSESEFIAVFRNPVEKAGFFHCLRRGFGGILAPAVGLSDLEEVAGCNIFNYPGKEDGILALEKGFGVEDLLSEELYTQLAASGGDFVSLNPGSRRGSGELVLYSGGNI